ncbi:hypothetical protein [Klebsiella pneumoniae]|nr:hypothetical protein [Klebsiella pneumoniae]
MTTHIKIADQYKEIDSTFAMFTYTENVQVDKFKRNIINYFSSYSDPQSREIWVPSFITEADKNSMLTDPRFHKMKDGKYINFNVLPSFLVYEENGKVTKLEEFSIKDLSGLGSVTEADDIKAITDAMKTKQYLKLIADSGNTYMVNVDDIYSVDTAGSPESVLINLSARYSFRSDTRPVMLSTASEIDKLTTYLTSGVLP